MSGIFSKLSVCQRISRGISGRRFLHNKRLEKPSTVIERTSKKVDHFDLATTYQLDRASCLSPTRFSLESFLEMKETPSSPQTLRKELLVRLAHLHNFLFSVDKNVQKQDSYLELLHLQNQNFRDILHLNKSTQTGIGKLRMSDVIGRSKL